MPGIRSATALMIWLVFVSTAFVLGSIGRRLILAPSVAVIAVVQSDACSVAFLAAGGRRYVVRSDCELMRAVGPGRPVVVHYSPVDPTTISLTERPEGAGGFLEGVALVAASVSVTLLMTASAVIDAVEARCGSSRACCFSCCIFRMLRALIIERPPTSPASASSSSSAVTLTEIVVARAIVPPHFRSKSAICIGVDRQQDAGVTPVVFLQP